MSIPYNSYCQVEDIRYAVEQRLKKEAEERSKPQNKSNPITPEEDKFLVDYFDNRYKYNSWGSLNDAMNRTDYARVRRSGTFDELKKYKICIPQYKAEIAKYEYYHPKDIKNETQTS